MRTEVRGFLQAWIDWADAGAPDSRRITENNPYGFWPDMGLCANCSDYEDSDRRIVGAYDQLKELFKEDGLNATYPFGEANYDGDLTKCPYRLDWVRSKLAGE